jgi:hypothetical protein
MKKVVQSIFIFCLSFLLFPIFAFANPQANIILTPENPAPKSNVSLRLESYSFDVNTAIITWELNGAVVLKGMGERTLTVKTGSIGQNSDISVLAETVDGTIIKQTINITPSSVLLLYEAPRSYTPLLYEGRSLPSDGALVQVTALPQISDNGVLVPPSSLSFVWFVNDTVYKGASGLGKQSALIRLDYLQSENEIKVVVRSPQGNTGQKRITVVSHPIMPILYKYDQILGPLTTSLVEKRFETIGDFTLMLEPFYVSRSEGQKTPTYNWYLNGLPTTPIGGRILALQPKENTYGTKLLSIVISGPDKRIQKANTKVELLFDTRKP